MVTLTVHNPAAPATSPLEIIIGLTPLELLNSAPDSAPAMMLFPASCFPLMLPMNELHTLYTSASTPAEFPRNGPRRVTLFSTAFNLRRGGAWGGARCRPSVRPQAPPSPSAET